MKIIGITYDDGAVSEVHVTTDGEDRMILVPVRHSHWIKHIDDLFPAESTQECSICHEVEYITLNNDHYCPNCGANMMGGK